jgi:hypothetical protein
VVVFRRSKQQQDGERGLKKVSGRREAPSGDLSELNGAS